MFGFSLFAQTATVPSTTGEVVTAISDTVGTIVPIENLGLYAVFGFIVGAGVLLVRRTVKALR